jgi:GYF domain 2
MYKVIGIDGQTYGPAGADQIRRWIAENRVNAQSRVQAEGVAEWKALGSLPEFADAFASQSPPAPSAPPPFSTSPPKPDAEAMAASVLARGYQVEIGSCLSRSWNLLTRHFWLIVGASFVLFLISDAIPLIRGVAVGSLYLFLLKLIRGERAEFGDAFAGFSMAFLQLFLAGLVAGFLTAMGLLLCVLPGIYLGVAWVFTLPLVIDKKLDFWPAMELSRKVVSQHWWTILGLVLANFLVILAGLAVCCIGVYVALPVAFGALAYAYDDIFGRAASPSNTSSG